MAAELVVNTAEALDCLNSIMDRSGSRYSIARSLHSDSDHEWLESGLLDQLSRYPQRETRVFGGQVKELGDAILRVGQTLTYKDNPSALMRLVGALAYRHLDVLAQLEGITHLVRSAASPRHHSDKDKYSKPLKDHVLHTACDLDAGFRLLEVKDAEGVPLFARLFEHMMNGLETVFPGLDAGHVRNLVKSTGEQGIRGFVEDCWIATALLHDIGYLHMLGLLLVTAYEGDEFGPSSRTDREASPLYRWFENVTSLTRRFDGDVFSGRAFDSRRKFSLPPLKLLWGDRDKLESPSDHHGFVSGYMLLEAILSGDDNPAWDSMGKAERCIAVIAAAACGFHSGDFLDHCQATLEAKDIKISRGKILSSLKDHDNPITIHLSSRYVPVKSLLADIEGGKADSMDKLIKELDDIITVPADSRTKARAGKYALARRAEYREFLKNATSVPAEALNLAEKAGRSELAPERVELSNRFLVEAALNGGIASSLEQSWQDAWRTNPMGVYLYAVDAIQEWVRLVWKRLDRQVFESDDKITVNILGSSVHPDGLAGAVGQCPIPEAILRFGALEETKPGVELKRQGAQLWVTKPLGDYDFDRLVGTPDDIQKRRNLSLAMQLITGYAGIKCTLRSAPLKTRGQDGVRELAVQMAEDLRRVLMRHSGGIPDEIVADGAPVVVEFDRSQSPIINYIYESLLALQDDLARRHVQRQISRQLGLLLIKRPPSAKEQQAARILDLIREAFRNAETAPRDEQPSLF